MVHMLYITTVVTSTAVPIAFSLMGFDSFTSKECMNIQEYTPLGSWPTDNILISETLKAMDSTPDQSDLVYTITVQGHGDYPTEKILENPEIAVSGAQMRLLTIGGNITLT